MTWNWQQPDWPNFSFDPLKLMPLETAFAHESGLLLGAFTHLTENDRTQLKVEMVSNEAMQVVSGRLDDPNVHFEAPPSERVMAEMAAFVDWFNRTATNAPNALPPLSRAGIAHLY